MAARTPDQCFEEPGLKLPPAPGPIGVYKPFLIAGNFVYVSGYGTIKEDKSLITETQN
jgi:enamine deaminase RidA (YjgF/YER057c/UK114 family)